MSQMGRVLGYYDAAASYAALADRIKRSFMRHFFDATVGDFSFPDGTLGKRPSFYGTTAAGAPLPSGPLPGKRGRCVPMQGQGGQGAATAWNGWLLGPACEWVNGSLCAQSMALALDLAPAADQPALQLALERSLLRDPHLRGGIFTVKWLLQTLNLDQALVAVMEKTYPSFGFMLAQNATTLWESWFFSDSVYRSEKMICCALESVASCVKAVVLRV